MRILCIVCIYFQLINLSILKSLVVSIDIANQSCQFQVNYEFNTSTGSLDMLNGKEHFIENLSLLLRWSPYSSETDLLKKSVFMFPFHPLMIG
jgi:hypothetical protein